MEQIAANAERASIKYKQVEYMTERLGQTYDGVISGVTEWGLYVELNENKCEGMIPIREPDDDTTNSTKRIIACADDGRNAHTASATLSPSRWHAPTWRKSSWTLHWLNRRNYHCQLQKLTYTYMKTITITDRSQIEDIIRKCPYCTVGIIDGEG